MWLTRLFGAVKNFDSDIVSKEIQQQRLSICNQCPFKRADFKTLLVNKKGVAQCKICKCSLTDKVLWSDEKCPKNKWT